MATARQSGHPSRRTNQSVSSTTSAGSSRSDRTSSRPGPSPAVESSVTRLLVSIKQLLESLSKWSEGELSETDVSDVYVRLGNDFNAAVQAFGQYNIDMSELASVPDNLRIVLETCLSEDASQEVLQQYLPEVRKIITGLLQGLRSKQTIYRQIVSNYRQQRASSEHPQGRDDGSSRERTSSRREPSGPSSRTQSMRSEPSDNLSRRSATSMRRHATNPASPRMPDRDVFVGGFVAPQPAQEESEPPAYRSSTPGPPPRPHLVEANSYPPTRARSASAVDTTVMPMNGHQSPPPMNGHQSTPLPSAPNGISDGDAPPTPRPPSGVPSHVKRYSLIDRPVSSGTPPPMVVVDEAQEEAKAEARAAEVRPETPTTPSQDGVPFEASAPAVQSSLNALKKSDTLERRASKRFSTYNISKMTGGSIRERHGAGANPNRRSLAVPGNLTAGDLAVLTEVDEEADEEPRPERSRSGRRRHDDAPPVPPLPPSRGPSPQQTPSPDKREASPVVAQAPSPDPSRQSTPNTCPVFLQVGREVKKVSIEPPISFSSLRVLFMDRFAYNPGKENFPAIYIRDPSSGVQYELEDTDEIKEKCLLSLNIEPLDQIKQHIDSQMSSLAQEIKDLRAAVANNRRASHPPPPPMIITQPLGEGSPTAPRPSDQQFRTVARRLSRLLPDDAPPLAPQLTGNTIQPQMTGASVMSEYSTRVVDDLKTQFDEVQNLRRDLGIMRQLYTEFMKQTKESLGTLRQQTQSVRQLATAKVGGTRAFIDDGKAKMDSRSQTVLTKMDELQDNVENIKDDVLKRNVTPKPQVLRKLRGEMDAALAELQSLREHILTVKPMWKKTWEEELQNIVEEQQFLQHQEELMGDLLEDHKAMEEMYGHVEKVISLKGSAKKPRGFKLPPMDEGHTGLSTVMLEIRGAAVDQERRMKAIAANEKNREKDLQGRSDEFQSELSSFVGGKKLKMTGGAEEIERVRQKRNEQTLKAMFTGSSAAPSSGSNTAVSSPAAALSQLPPS